MTEEVKSEAPEKQEPATVDAGDQNPPADQSKALTRREKKEAKRQLFAAKQSEEDDADELEGVTEAKTKSLDDVKTFDHPVEFTKSIKVTGSITLVSADGKSNVSLQAREDIAGIWVQSASKNDKHPKSSIAIYDDDNGPVIGFYRDTGEANLALTFAVCLDKDGNPQFQITNGRGNVGFLNLGELLDKVKPDWR